MSSARDVTVRQSALPDGAATEAKQDDLIAAIGGTGLPAGWIVVHKFGRSSVIDSGSLMTVCDFLAKDTLYTYPPDSGLVMTLQSDDALDTSLTYSLQGLAVDGSIQDLEVTTNAADGTTPVAAGTWRRIWRMLNITTGESPSLGDVTVENGGTIYCQAAAAYQQSMMALYTVPAGYTGYICAWTFNAPSGRVISGSGWARLHNGTFTQKTAASGIEDDHMRVHVADLDKPWFGYTFPALADMEVRAVSTRSGQEFEVDFHVVLVPIP